MLQEKDMNILTTDIQQERQENNEIDEDQEEFEKLKEVIPTVCQTDSSQVKIVQEATHYIQYLRQEVAQKFGMLGVQVDGTTDVTSPCWLAQFLANQGVVFPDITQTSESPDHLTAAGGTQTHSGLTCISNLPDQLTEDNDTCRLTTGTSNSEVTKMSTEHKNVASSRSTPDSDCAGTTRSSNLPVQSTNNASISEKADSLRAERGESSTQ